MKRRPWWPVPLFALAIAGIATGVWLWQATADWRKPAPMLIRNLPDAGGSRQNRALHARLVSRFPVGSSAAALVVELQNEGFSLDRQTTTGGVRRAHWHRDGMPCADDAEVSWTADAKGRLATIDGSYGYACL